MPIHTLVRRTVPASLVLLALAPAAGAHLHAQAAQDWCQEREVGRNQHCEVRQITMRSHNQKLRIDVGPNGSIRVESYSGSDVRVAARVVTRAGDVRAAEDMAREVTIDAREGEVQARGPRTRGNSGWSVSVRVQVPRGTAIDAATTNGAIHVEATHASVDARTTNGSITLVDVDAAMDLRTTNGAIRVSVAPSVQQVDGIQIRTTNGSVQLALPERVSASLDFGTTNGSINTDLPISVQGRLNRRQLTGTLGGGGPEVRIRTTNGSIRLSRS